MNLSGQALKNIVMLYCVSVSRLIFIVEEAVITSDPNSGGGETVTTYSSIITKLGLGVNMKLKVPIFCWIPITVKFAEKLRSETVYKVTDK